MSTRDEVLKQLGVSRETSDRLEVFASLLAKWNTAINLVAPASIPDLWSRHFMDSAQLLARAPDFGVWLDIGTGGGFPGLVCAILASESKPGLTFALTDSDQRKCTFLRTVLHKTGVTAAVHATRIEALPPQSAAVISARALAPLDQLLAHAERHLAADGRALFLKGARHEEELAKALENWRFEVQKHHSTTDPSGAILEIGNLQRV